MRRQRDNAVLVGGRGVGGGEPTLALRIQMFSVKVTAHQTLAWLTGSGRESPRRSRKRTRRSQSRCRTLSPGFGKDTKTPTKRGSMAE